MAEFFKKIGQGVSTASKNVKESIDISRKRLEIKKQINDGKEKEDKIKLSIGNNVYNAYKKDLRPDLFTELCKEIDDMEVQIKRLESELLELDGIKLCENCRNKIPLDAVFCSKCGEKQNAVFGTSVTDIKTDNVTTDEDNMISL